VKAQNIISKYEPQAGGIVAAYRAFATQLGEPPCAPHLQLALTKRSSFEEAANAAEKMAADWQLGDMPARALPHAIEQRLGVPVLFVDAPLAISGAASRMPELSVILINRNEPEYRRNYDLAHELFHVLTWSAMPPNEFDAVMEKKSRVEILADAFAAALLMPRAVLEPLWETRGKRELHGWINATARQLGVSGQALFYRMKALNWLEPEEALRIDFERLKWQGGERRDSEKPRPYSEKFVDMLHRMLDGGWISVRRAAALLNCTGDELQELFRSYGKKAPFAL
jgi:Zn-dependent peptidase ImmA (M78 family)